MKKLSKNLDTASNCFWYSEKMCHHMDKPYRDKKIYSYSRCPKVCEKFIKCKRPYVDAPEKNAKNMHLRPSWHEYFMGFVVHAATRSVCLRRSVGAVLTKERHIIATGYNGPPRGIEHCTQCKRKASKKGANLTDCYAVHAEQNCIVQAARTGENTLGADLYVTVHPCVTCAKLIVNAGIVNVFYKEEYNNVCTSRDILKMGGVTIDKIGAKE